MPWRSTSAFCAPMAAINPADISQPCANAVDREKTMAAIVMSASRIVKQHSYLSHYISDTDEDARPRRARMPGCLGRRGRVRARRATPVDHAVGRVAAPAQLGVPGRAGARGAPPAPAADR